MIQNLRAIEWEAFVDQTLKSKQERFQNLSEQLQKVEAELATCDLASPVKRGKQAIVGAVRSWKGPVHNTPWAGWWDCENEGIERRFVSDPFRRLHARHGLDK